MAQNMGHLTARMPGYFNTLGQLGQTPQNATDALPNARSSFFGNVEMPWKQNQRQYGRDLTRDKSHDRINDILNQKMKEQSQLSFDAMKTDYTNRSRIMDMQGKDQGLSNQLSALGMMSGQFFSPLGVQMMENYYKPGVSPGPIIAAGVTGLSALNQYMENQKLQSLLGTMGKGVSPGGGTGFGDYSAAGQGGY
jgi:hypothetical protein